ncbi:MAG TPA: sugar phosphate isomerase/epimerase family protein [Planctomycetota bacterium]|nr:sugar phosphate isomerase/epimerase family protein [Planctomycetota bacterium]
MNPTSLTVSLVPEARGGPFILWDPLPVACAKAKALGYDAIEVFPPSAEGVDADLLERSLNEHGLKLAAMGTGAGAVIRKLTLTSPDAEVRRQGREFVNSMIDFAGRFGAPAILGSMQGRWGGPVDKPTALGHLRTALDEFGERARKAGTTFLLEPLNRYEGNVVNTIGDAVELIRTLSTRNVTILADLFHMNIEEDDLLAALRSGHHHLSHVQLADSNRRPAGQGHTNFRAVAMTLDAIAYKGYLSAEALPWPDPDTAARLAMEGIRRFFR